MQRTCHELVLELARVMFVPVCISVCTCLFLGSCLFSHPEGWWWLRFKWWSKLFTHGMLLIYDLFSLLTCMDDVGLSSLVMRCRPHYNKDFMMTNAMMYMNEMDNDHATASILWCLTVPPASLPLPSGWGPLLLNTEDAGTCWGAPRSLWISMDTEYWWRSEPRLGGMNGLDLPDIIGHGIEQCKDLWHVSQGDCLLILDGLLIG